MNKPISKYENIQKKFYETTNKNRIKSVLIVENRCFKIAIIPFEDSSLR